MKAIEKKIKITANASKAAAMMFTINDLLVMN